MLARLRSVARMIVGRSRWEQDLKDELQFHIEQRVEHLAGAGLPREEAIRRARFEFGGVERYKEGCRDVRGVGWLDELSRNVLYAWRSLRQHPGFTAVAVLSLALGIGANLAVFGVLHRLVLNKLPVRDPDGLYQVVVRSGSGPSYTMPLPKFDVIRDNFTFFNPLFGWSDRIAALTAGEYKRSAQIAPVTANYFEALGLRASLGRLFTSQDGEARAADIAVISHDLWQAAFGSSPRVIGSTVKVGDVSFVVIGVAPSGFSGTQPGLAPALYLPLHGYERVVPGILTRPNMAWLHVMTRLIDDASLESVQAAIREQWQQIDEPNRARRGRSWRDTLVLEDGSRGFSTVRMEFSRAVLVLMGLVAAVFLIACANLATLLFVRGAGRAREMSIRLALGASRAQLVRQWMTECLLLSVAGGLTGLLAARWITDLLLVFVAESDRPWLRFDASPTIVLVSVGLTLAAGLLFGLLPGVQATHTRPEAALRSQSGAVTAPRGFLTHAVLAGQLAASLVLVVGAALFARTLWNLNAASGGFDRKTVVYADPQFGGTKVPQERRSAVMNEVLDRVSRSPQLAAVSMGSPPMVWADGGWWWLTGGDYVPGPNEDNTAFINPAQPGYFDVLGIPIVAGRDFEERDRPSDGKPATVVIVNEQLARRYFPTRSALGQRIKLQTWFEIVGIARNTKNKSLRDVQRDVLYLPMGREQFGAILARPAAGVAPQTVEAELRAAFAAVVKDLSVETGALEDAVQRSLARDRLVAQLSAAFGILGVVLASIGLYGAIAHSVNSRTREIGIRIAIGARARDVMWMVQKQGLIVTAIGVAIGLPASIAGSQLVQLAPLRSVALRSDHAGRFRGRSCVGRNACRLVARTPGGTARSVADAAVGVNHVRSASRAGPTGEFSIHWPPWL